MSEVTARQQDRKVHPTVAKLEELRPHLSQLGIDPARFKRIVLNECQRNPALLECTPASLFAAVLLSAQLDLEPGPPLGLSWFIPRRQKGKRQKVVSWMLGYKGEIELARRAGIVITVGTVYKADHFIEHGGTSPRIEHRPTLRNRGDMIAWYAVAKFPDGRTAHRVLNRDDVEARKAQSDAKDNGPWVTHYDAMARKSAVRALFSQLPMSPQAREAHQYDEQVLHLAGGDVSVLSIARDDDTPATGSDHDHGDHELGGAAATADQILEIDNLARQCELDDDALAARVAERYDGVAQVDDLTQDQADDLIEALRQVAP